MRCFSGPVVALALSCLFTGPPQAAAAFEGKMRCSDAGLQVQCGEGLCETSPNFTPMQISLSPDMLSVCAYSGCWEGPVTLYEDETGLFALGKELAWQADGSQLGIFRLAIAMPALEGVVHGEGFASPVSCELQ